MFRVLSEPLNVVAVVNRVRAPACGAVVTFCGHVRNQTRGREVVRLEYEAYAPMAIRKMEQIAQDVAARWSSSTVAIDHRIGVLTPEEMAVVIAVATPHRKEAFSACEYVLERLKQDVPIWKKEIYRDGETWVGLGP